MNKFNQSEFDLVKLKIVSFLRENGESPMRIITNQSKSFGCRLATLQSAFWSCVADGSVKVDDDFNASIRIENIHSPMLTGILTLNRIHEGPDRWIAFDKPLIVDYTIDVEKKIAYVTYDFGMNDEFSIDPVSNFCCKPTEDSADLPYNVERTVKFDLFHAFMHTSEDPNYGHRHWALFAFLKDRVTCKDHESPYKPTHVP
jgi:hypothetical protein